MLLITRKSGETIHIGDDITIIILDNEEGFGDDITTVGIEAPKAINIVRGELLNKKDEADD